MHRDLTDDATSTSLGHTPSSDDVLIQITWYLCTWENELRLLILPSFCDMFFHTLTLLSHSTRLEDNASLSFQGQILSSLKARFNCFRKTSPHFMWQAIQL